MVFKAVVEGPEAYAADPCVPADTETPRLYTQAGIEYVQTPESAFSGLVDAGYPWNPHYAIIDGMRMHYIDEGPKEADEIVLLLHGQPSWSFLYRKMVPVLVDRGYRVISPDWIGMGRSDKPTSMTEHTYLKHVARLKAFVAQVIPEALDKPTITLFAQDWGSLIGLRTVGDEPSWFRRVISANGMLPVMPPGINPMTVPSPVNYNCSDTRTAMEMFIERFSSSPCGLDQSCFSIWINYALTSPTFQASDILQIATSEVLDTATIESYDAPFPSHIYTAAPRTFPSMVAAVLEPDFGNTAAWESLQNFTLPYLALAGEDDPNLGSVEVQSNLYNNIQGAQSHSFEHKRFSGAGHFIQEDAGAEVAAYVADFIDGTLVGDEQLASSSQQDNSSAYMCESNQVALILVLLMTFLHRF